MNSNQTIYSVSDLVAEMRRLMESSYPEIWIEGELSSLSTPASGHAYFSLKDAQSQLRCAMFRNRLSISKYKPKAGDQVRVRAKISVYTARGDLQCIVQHIEEAGAGLLQQRFEELKTRLAAEGLFDTQHKVAIPEHVKRIGVITSPSGAALHDVLATLKRRNRALPVTIYPAVVQGDGAAQTLINAVQSANRHATCDVLLLTRGGGSMEDLWCFNNEALARAIFSSKIPIISAVGHEVDVSIADFVADLRAPTPTAAAELVSADHQAVEEQLQQLMLRLSRASNRSMQSRAQGIDWLGKRLQHPGQRLRLQSEQLAKFRQRLRHSVSRTLVATERELIRQRRDLLRSNPQRKILSNREQVIHLGSRLQQSTLRHLAKRQDWLATTAEHLNAVSPLATLGRGFAIVRKAEDSAIVRQTDQVTVGDQLEVELARGSLQCDVTSISQAE